MRHAAHSRAVRRARQTKAVSSTRSGASASCQIKIACPAAHQNCGAGYFCLYVAEAGRLVLLLVVSHEVAQALQGAGEGLRIGQEHQAEVVRVLPIERAAVAEENLLALE